MSAVNFYFDFISPYAYLAFKRIPEIIGSKYAVNYRPVLFAGLLKHFGQLGPAEIPGKREWTFTQSLWEAKRYQIPFQLPKKHPFNPLPYLRLSLNSSNSGKAQREVCEKVFDHIWQTGMDPSTEESLNNLLEKFSGDPNPHDPDAKETLKNNTNDAIEAGVFGVPTALVDGHLFWGLDSMDMLRHHISGNSTFADYWGEASAVGVAIERKR